MPASPRPRRSALYVPGSNARAIAKVREVAADVIIFDLEDSVSPAQKEPAREAVARAVAELSAGKREIVVRVNGLDTPWIARDIAAVAASNPSAILFPKIQRMDDIRRARAALSAAAPSRDLGLWLMMETPAAILNAAAIAAISKIPVPEITGFVVGTNDLAAEMNIPVKLGRAALLPHLSQVVLAARAHGLAILDGTFNDLDDRKALKTECMQGREMGFDGKTVIHPTQVPIANDAYAPDEEELIWAQKIVDAFAEPDNAGVEVMRLSGRMVERLHERAARRMLSMARDIKLLESEAASARKK
jgi:citrate lyase subunit beta/citryl-CoA lyase